ncbi:MucBP domain-containing protein [Pediococcus ethanolidurans]|uniref:MucBP domain-containing protein n=1 Tax=Pediococcus ethanolidurans TaxID=319653 RepID=UPI0037CC9282
MAANQPTGGSYTFAVDNNANIVVHLVHAHTVKTNAAQTTDTVVYTGAHDVTPANQVVTIQWTSNTDNVTNQVVWTTDVPSTTVETPTVSGYTPDKSQVTFTNGTPVDQSQTVTYTADKQSTNIQYVDDDNNETQVGNLTELNGATNETVNWNAVIPAGYQLAVNQATSGSYAFAAGNNANIVVHLVHAHTIKNNAAQTTDTVTYTGTNGENPVDQSVTIQWTSNTDEVTNNLVWTTDVPTTTIATPTVSGYTPDKTEVSFTNKTASNDTPTDQTQEVTYTADDISYTVTPVDPNGDPIPGTNPSDETGKTGTPITTPDVPGYTAETTVPNVPGNGGNVNVIYTPNAETVTVHYVYADGSKAANDKTVTGVTDGTYSVTSPTIKGYHADQSVVSGTYGSAAGEFTITYTKDAGKQVTPTPGDQTGKPKDQNISVTKPNKNLVKQNKGVSATKQTAKKAVVQTVGQVQPSTTQVKAVTGNKAVKQTKATVLPQTDEKSTSIFALIGMAILTLLGFIGIDEKQRKQNEK